MTNSASSVTTSLTACEATTTTSLQSTHSKAISTPSSEALTPKTQSLEAVAEKWSSASKTPSAAYTRPRMGCKAWPSTSTSAVRTLVQSESKMIPPSIPTLLSRHFVFSFAVPTTDALSSSVVAAIKYSIKSSLSVPPSSCDFSSSSSSTTQHRLTPFLNFFANHLSVTNDLFSYDKEIRALNRGQASQMINLVHVIKTLTGLQSTDDAKAVAFALQLQIEREMREEVEKLLVDQSRDCDDGGKREEAKFLNAVMQAAAGHVMFCMTTGRYGGEAARIAS